MRIGSSFILTHRLIRLSRRRGAAAWDEAAVLLDGRAVAGNDRRPAGDVLRNNFQLAEFYIDAPDFCRHHLKGRVESPMRGARPRRKARDA